MEASDNNKLDDNITASSVDDNEELEVEWEDWEEDDLSQQCLCLFCPLSFNSAKETWGHCKDTHCFDLHAIKQQLALDIYSSMRLVNFIRTQALEKEGRADDWNKGIFSGITRLHPLFSDDNMLLPVIQEDALLCSLHTEDDEDYDFINEESAIERSRIEQENSTPELIEKLEISERRAKEAEQRASELEIMVSEYKSVIARLMQDREGRNTKSDSESESDSSADEKATPTPTQDNNNNNNNSGDDNSKNKKSKEKQKDIIDPEDAGVSEGYFSGYGHFGIHEAMLKDVVRTDSYRDAMYLNKHMFKDQVVLDIGCGTSILSMFAAKSGAKKVIGIDRSNIIFKAQKIVSNNNLSDTVTLLRGEVEKVTLPVEKVDIIISEWMGYFLLFESMLDTVLYARDKWLNPGGIVQPSHLQMLISAASMEDYFVERVDYWRNVYGFDMDCMKEGVLREAQVDIVENKEIISAPCQLQAFDVMKMKKEDQEFTAPFELVIERDDVSCHALVSYFDTDFKWGSFNGATTSTDITFSTGPHAKDTHWKQTVFVLEEPAEGLKKGDKIKGSLICRRNAEYFRALNIVIEWWVDRQGQPDSKPHKIQNFHLGH
eukprot:TRINITY_DN6108_c0_g1_i1.p1 TRINITY_DN6108_c0_g1~~TRINITY_DN6108_c0_g1_i1.p1  ORF type:complete len:603 (+),score=183.95 TRINITY_DN6108_c0_g1_i1:130-1938(+)